MRNILLALFLMIVLSSCDEKPVDITTYNTYYNGNHSLRKFNAKERTVSSYRANYFLLIGSGKGETYTISEIAFSWKNINDEYIFSKVPFEKVRIKFDNKIDTPYVTFNMGVPTDRSWYRNQLTEPDGYVNENLNQFLFSLTIHCKEEDYTQDVNLNELK